MLAKSPEWRGDKTWKIHIWVCGIFTEGKQKNCLASCYISTLFLRGEIIIIMTKKHLMVDIPRPKSISKSSLLTTSALDLICHFTALSPSVVFYPKTIFTCCNSTVPSPHLGSSATFRLKIFHGRFAWNGSQISFHFDNVCRFYP